MTIESFREDIFSKRVHIDSISEMIEKDDNLKKRIAFYTQAYPLGKVTINSDDLNELRALIDILGYTYTQGKPLVEDRIYDILYEKLIYEDSTEVISSDVEVDQKFKLVPHEYPMMRGTLEKVYYLTSTEKRDNPSRRYLDEWIKQKEKLYKDISGKDIDLNDCWVKVTGKEDGCSVIRNVDKDGNEQWLARGDTENNLASDITHLMKNVFVHHYRQAKYRNGYCVKYELVISEQEKDKINEFFGTTFKNSRSIVAGYLHNINEIGHIQKALTAIPLRIIGKDDVEHAKQTNTIAIEDMIEDSIYPSIVCKLGDREMLRQFALQNTYFQGIRRDGIVITLIDKNIQKVLGRENNINRFEVAYKFTEEVGYSFVENIEFYVSGYGIITPICVIKPIKLKGNTITRISLSNVARFNELKLAIGDRVKIMYDIIPYLTIDSFCEKSGEHEIRFPDRCPMCSSDIIIQGLFAKCSNMECVSRCVGNIQRFMSAIGVKGIAEKTIRLLRDHGIVNNISDMFELNTRTNEILSIDGFAQVKLSQMITEINRHRVVDDCVFFGGLGLQSIGRRLFKELFDIISYEELLEICSTYDYPRLESIGFHNIGATRLKSIYDYITQHMDEIKSIMKYVSIVKSTKGSKGEVVFTMYRDQSLEKELIANGYSIGDSLTKRSVILTCPDYVLQFNKSSSKIDKAKKLGIEIVGESKLREMLTNMKNE